MRFIAEDDIWLSPQYGRDSMAVNVVCSNALEWMKEFAPLSMPPLVSLFFQCFCLQLPVLPVFLLVALSFHLADVHPICEFHAWGRVTLFFCFLTVL